MSASQALNAGSIPTFRINANSNVKVSVGASSRHEFDLSRSRLRGTGILVSRTLWDFQRFSYAQSIWISQISEVLRLRQGYGGHGNIVLLPACPAVALCEGGYGEMEFFIAEKWNLLKKKQFFNGWTEVLTKNKKTRKMLSWTGWRLAVLPRYEYRMIWMSFPDERLFCFAVIIYVPFVSVFAGGVHSRAETMGFQSTSALRAEIISFLFTVRFHSLVISISSLALYDFV